MFSLFSRKLHNRILVLCALPLDKKNVFSLFNGGNSDFLKSMADGQSIDDAGHLWKFYRPVAMRLSGLLSSYKSAGATVMTNFRCDDLSRIDRYDAVILIAHHMSDRDAIELCDGPVDTSEIVRAIPSEYSGVLDMSSCHSSSFQLEIKMHAPSSHIIATKSETSLGVRIAIYEQVLHRLKNEGGEYSSVFSNVVSDLFEQSSKKSVQETPSISLGGQQRSTIFAPSSVMKGETFIVQVFLHKSEDSEEIELQARMVDDAAQKRNTKPLSIKLKKGDKVDVSLHSTNASKEDFTIPYSRQSVVWQNEPCSMEFSVSVGSQCNQSAFCGIVLLAVNKIPAGSMMFRSEISEKRKSNDCALFEASPYDKDKEMSEARDALLDKMRNFMDNSSNLDEKDSSQKEMCELCLKLLSEDLPKENRTVPRVFISSTSDMVEYRKVVEERVKACEMFPDMYELWGQGCEYPRDMCCRHILQSDFFICLLGSRYGYVEPIWDRSMTEIEYMVAKSSGIPILIYILNDGREKETRQQVFLNEIQTKITVGMFKDSMTLALTVNNELLTLKYSRK